MRRTLIRTVAAVVLSLGAVGLAGGVASANELSAPVTVPSHPTGGDYVNAWNKSGALAGAGAAGLASSAWAGAIPSIVQGAADSLQSAPAAQDEQGVAAPVVVPSDPTGGDYVNAWNKSGALAGAGAAGLASSAWAGAIPSIVQGAADSLQSAPAMQSKHRLTAQSRHRLAAQDEQGVAAPVVVPSDPTGADYVNAWNKSGALAGAGAAGLASSAWAGAIPSIVQGALDSLN
jgi:hypothetical protein